MYYSSPDGDILNGLDYSQFANGNSLDHLAGIATFMSNSPPSMGGNASVSTPSSEDPNGVSMSPHSASGLGSVSTSDDAGMSLLYLSWPANLPDITVTRHLINAFFTHHIHASRLFHPSSFFGSLDLHPTDPKFPCSAVLHAMCAVGSIYTALVPTNNISDSYAFDVMTGERRPGKQRITSFGELQAKFSKACIEDGLDRGENLFECTQAQIILTWFYLSQARWVETLVLPPGRQWSHDKDVLSVHLEDQMDSFIVFTKASILISRVKNFNLRFKSLAYTGDPSVISPNMKSLDASGGLENFNPKDTPGFRDLDQLVTSFKASFPPHMKNPMKDDKLDAYLYSAWNVVHLSQILLHEPFARPGSYACISAYKILSSSRAIVEFLHSISSTSYDVSSMDLYPFLCWFMAGRVLVRFLKAAQDAQAQDQVIPLQAEINFLRTMLAKAGERVPLAYRYAKMLGDTLVQTCGVQEVESPSAMPPREFNYVSQHYDYTASLFSYKTPPMPPPPSEPPVTPPLAGAL
ncbi:hypothetical protein PHLCEN_2v6212 [Hermanssonia centrifuga]|uniref:Transcription factor domain-containing protein n=1 Tax=Hermanssonia centrifuga TaxID=98765 RepID=A0A2R6P057_9APHY|nr:hypothetical protein PHLCEN_2v6212 [Hermanssonia centrifuga]